jgi:hypothetical protein
MKIIGEDTQEFLNNNAKLKEYLTVVDKDFQGIGIDKNYIMLTHLEIAGEETVYCICFYFTHIPSKLKMEASADILADHSEMLDKLSVFIHFAEINEESILELGNNPNIAERSDMFLSTVYR